MSVEAKLKSMGYDIAPAARGQGKIEPAVRTGNLIFTSGQVSSRGSESYIGKVGSDLTVEQGYAAARLTALAILASLQRALGDLDRITAWTRVFGMVNSAPGFVRQPAVINGFSELVIELFGPEVGAHARSAVGLFELPFSIPVEIEAEVEFSA